MFHEKFIVCLTIAISFVQPILHVYFAGVLEKFRCSHNSLTDIKFLKRSNVTALFSKLVRPPVSLHWTSAEMKPQQKSLKFS